MKKIYEDIKNVFESKVSFRILCLIGIFIIALFIFVAGVTVGYHKASFGRAWGEHYYENFGLGDRQHGPSGTLMSQIGMMNYFPTGHGATGKIIKIEPPELIMQDKDNTEKIIIIKTDTRIREGSENVTIDELKINDFVVIIGTPNEQGQIEAKLIRAIPSPEFLQ
ncbi:MAG TPA: hypothetical protein VK675_02465 [Candidatus Paceibacterota bacterium]|nr:hypothetical protein [Candidatus Paceibacterota bacterium]